MTLNEFCAAFSGNTNVSITLVDVDDKEIIRFNAGGYQGVEGDVLARTVRRIRIEHSTEIRVSLNNAPIGATGVTG